MNVTAEKKRVKIIDKMHQIDRLRQGTLSEQYYGSGKNKKGPYYVLQGYDGARKHWSKRIPRSKVDDIKNDLNAGTRLKDLFQEFADVTEKATVAHDKSNSKKKA